MLAVINYLTLCLLKAFSDKVQGLHLTDREACMVLGDDVGVKRLVYGLIGNAVFEFPKAAHNSGPVGFLQSILINAHSKLDCEPIYCSQPFELDLTRSK